MYKPLAAALGLFALTACGVSYPVAVIGGDGTTLKGFASNTIVEGGTFYATDGRVSCDGRFRQGGEVGTVGFPVRCDNGLTGIGTAVFATPSSGTGLVTMRDGSRWQFIFGRGAAAL